MKNLMNVSVNTFCDKRWHWGRILVYYLVTSNISRFLFAVLKSYHISFIILNDRNKIITVGTALI
jgi:hypothetical protein